MRTIAISIDDGTVQRLDALASASAGVSRSSLVREALGLYLRERDRLAADAQDRAGYGADREALAREEAALIDDQASS